MAQCCEGEGAVLLGSCRLIRNEDVSPEAIREGGLRRTVQQPRPVLTCYWRHRGHDQRELRACRGGGFGNDRK